MKSKTLFPNFKTIQFSLFLSIGLLMATPSVIAQKTSLRDSAMNYFSAKPLNYSSYEWQTRADSALRIDPTHDKLWQEKAMPFLKNGDWASWLQNIAKSVELKPFEWLPYRGFCRAIFMKDYEIAIKDFEAAEKIKPQEIHFVMDHSHDYYKALCYLELNKPQLALTHIQKSVNWQLKNKGADWVHYSDLFYLAATHYDLKNYPLALENIDKSIEKYPQFPSALYYKALILKSLGREKEALPFIESAIRYHKKGFYMNEDNEAYTHYPKQVGLDEMEELKVLLSSGQ